MTLLDAYEATVKWGSEKTDCSMAYGWFCGLYLFVERPLTFFYRPLVEQVLGCKMVRGIAF